MVTFAQGTPTVKHGDVLLVLAGHGAPKNFLGGTPLPPSMAMDEIKDIHARIKTLLAAAVGFPNGEAPSQELTGLEPEPLADRVALVTAPKDDPIQLSLVRLTVKMRRPAMWALQYRSPNDVVAAVHAVAQLIVSSAGARLVACGWCGQPLMAIRKQKHYQPRHAAAARDARWNTARRRLARGRRSA